MFSYKKNYIKEQENLISKLETDLDDKKRIIDELKRKLSYSEKIINAFEKVSKLSTNELAEAENIIEAHETIGELQRQEQIDKHKTIEALETVEELARHELIDKDQTIKAYENVEELARDELIDKDQTIKAYESVDELTRDELIDRDKTIDALETVEDLARTELVDRDQTIQAYESVSELQRLEQIEKNETIDAYENVEELARTELVEKSKTIDALEAVQELSSEEIKNRDKTINALEGTSKLSSKEKIELETTIQAQETVLEMSQQEKIERDNFIKAHEETHELSRLEAIDKDSTIKAQEEILELSRLENIEKENIIEAQESVIELSHNEVMEKDKTINAQEETLELSRLEAIDKDSTIKAQEETLELSRQEAIERNDNEFYENIEEAILEDDVVFHEEPSTETIEEAEEEVFGTFTITEDIPSSFNQDDQTESLDDQGLTIHEDFKPDENEIMSVERDEEIFITKDEEQIEESALIISQDVDTETKPIEDKKFEDEVYIVDKTIKDEIQDVFENQWEYDEIDILNDVSEIKETDEEINKTPDPEFMRYIDEEDVIQIDNTSENTQKENFPEDFTFEETLVTDELNVNQEAILLNENIAYDEKNQSEKISTFERDEAINISENLSSKDDFDADEKKTFIEPSMEIYESYDSEDEEEPLEEVPIFDITENELQISDNLDYIQSEQQIETLDDEIQDETIAEIPVIKEEDIFTQNETAEQNAQLIEPETEEVAYAETIQAETVDTEAVDSKSQENIELKDTLPILEENNFTDDFIVEEDDDTIYIENDLLDINSDNEQEAKLPDTEFKDEQLEPGEKLDLKYVKSNKGDDIVVLKNELEFKEKIIEAHEQVHELSRQELIDRDKLLNAHEYVERLAFNEQADQEKIIEAHEIVEELSRQEQIDKEKIIDAQEKVEELARLELIEKDEIIAAQEAVEELAKSELIDRDKTITAQENVLDLATMEKADLEETITAHEEVEELARDELIEKDKVIAELKSSSGDLTDDDMDQLSEKIGQKDEVLKILDEEGITDGAPTEELLLDNFEETQEENKLDKNVYEAIGDVQSETNYKLEDSANTEPAVNDTQGFLSKANEHLLKESKILIKRIKERIIEDLGELVLIEEVEETINE